MEKLVACLTLPTPTSPRSGLLCFQLTLHFYLVGLTKSATYYGPQFSDKQTVLLMLRNTSNPLSRTQIAPLNTGPSQNSKACLVQQPSS